MTGSSDNINRDTIIIKLDLFSWEIGKSGLFEPFLKINLNNLNSTIPILDNNNNNNNSILNEFQKLWCGEIENDDKLEWYFISIFNYIFNDQLPIDFSEINYNLLIIHNHNELNAKFKSIINKTIREVVVLTNQEIQFIESSLMSNISSGLQNSLIIEINWNSTNIIPIYDLRILSTLIETTKRSLSDIHQMMLHNRETPLCTIDNVLEKIDHFSEGDDKYINEIFFQDIKKWELNDLDELSILQLLIKIYKNLPIDSKKKIFENIIILTPLNFKFIKFKSKLLNLINEFINNDSKLVNSLGPWSGGSLYSYSYSDK